MCVSVCNMYTYLYDEETKKKGGKMNRKTNLYTIIFTLIYTLTQSTTYTNMRACMFLPKAQLCVFFEPRRARFFECRNDP